MNDVKVSGREQGITVGRDIRSHKSKSRGRMTALIVEEEQGGVETT